MGMRRVSLGYAVKSDRGVFGVTWVPPLIVRMTRLEAEGYMKLAGSKNG